MFISKIIIIIILSIIINFINCENLPQNIKLSFSKIENSIKVTWYTIDSAIKPMVLYNEGDNSNTPFTSDNVKILTYDTKGFTGYQNSVEMTNLTESLMYFYKVGDGATNEWSEKFNFTTNYFYSNQNGEIAQPFTVSFFGDMGYDQNNGNLLNSDYYTVKNLLSRFNQYDFIVHVGDIAYAGAKKGSGLEGNETIWNEFQNSIQPLTSSKVYLTVPGNHDTFGLFDLPVYRKTWQMMVDEETSSWYSYDYNGVHFIGISSESDYYPLSAQHTWIENDLKTYRKSNPTGWIVMYSHRPFYCSVVWGWCDNENIESDKKLYIWSLEELLYRYQVDVFISGHTHSYEYSLPVYKGNVFGTFDNPGATIHIVVGTGGNHQGEDLVWQPLQPWSTGLRTSDNGFGFLTVLNSTTLNWKFISNQNNTVIDEFNILKGKF